MVSRSGRKCCNPFRGVRRRNDSSKLRSRFLELGIRIALGAGRRDVLRLVLGQGTRLALWGIGLGVIFALALSKFIAALLYGISPADPLTFAAVASLLVLVALAACYVPAQRATRVDPIEALRY